VKLAQYNMQLKAQLPAARVRGGDWGWGGEEKCQTAYGVGWERTICLSHTDPVPRAYGAGWERTIGLELSGEETRGKQGRKRKF
jgi:hypothetical protein